MQFPIQAIVGIRETVPAATLVTRMVRILLDSCVPHFRECSRWRQNHPPAIRSATNAQRSSRITRPSFRHRAERSDPDNGRYRMRHIHRVTQSRPCHPAARVRRDALAVAARPRASRPDPPASDAPATVAPAPPRRNAEASRRLPPAQKRPGAVARRIWVGNGLGMGRSQAGAQPVPAAAAAIAWIASR